MPTRTWTEVDRGRGWMVWKVTGLLNGDTSSELDLPQFTDKTIHVSGTFGVGGNARLRGMNTTGGNPQPLHPADAPAGALSTITAELLKTLVEDPLYLVADVSAGDGTTTLTCVVKASTNRN